MTKCTTLRYFKPLLILQKKHAQLQEKVLALLNDSAEECCLILFNGKTWWVSLSFLVFSWCQIGWWKRGGKEGQNDRGKEQKEWKKKREGSSKESSQNYIAKEINKQGKKKEKTLWEIFYNLAWSYLINVKIRTLGVKYSSLKYKILK